MISFMVLFSMKMFYRFYISILARYIIGFILYAVADVDQKQRVKQRIIQTMFGIIGIILAISIVNLIIDLF